MKRFIACVAALVLLLSALPLSASAATAQSWDFARLQGYYKTQGRVALNGTALEMDTTSSGFEFYFEGSGDVTLSVEVCCTYSTDLYLTVIVDGVRSRMQVDAGQKAVTVTKTLTLASGLAQGMHHIEVYKQSEAIVSLMKVNTITFTGTPLSTPPLDKITIEVVGDSLSSGASMWSEADGYSIAPDYPYYLDGTKTYAYVTGEALGANVRVTQASGYGCVMGFNTNGLNLQDLYPYTNYWRSSTALYDFDPPAQIVVINLGTNDYMARSQTGLTDAEFKEGVLNLLNLVREKNPEAPVVWCTGMMGIAYPDFLSTIIEEAGGAAAGYYYLELPLGMSGGYSHSNVEEHAAAGAVLTEFILENCLPAEYMDEFSTSEVLTSLVSEAEAMASPSAALTSAIKWAKAELSWGTTDAYRLGYRYQTLKAAMQNAVTVDLMPREYIATCPVESNGSYIWPYYGAEDGTVTLYKGGEGYYWPKIETLLAPHTVNVEETPYLHLKTTGTAYFNLHLYYKDATGTDQSVSASMLAGNDAVDFSPGDVDMVLDLRSYINGLGHADENGNIALTACYIYTSGEMDVYTKLYTCALSSSDGTDLPTEITGAYTIQDGILVGVSAGTTAAQLIDAMDYPSYLTVKNEDGTAISDTLATGMTLVLTVNGETVQEVLVAVTGDVNGDGVLNTTDCRLMLSHFAGAYDFTAVQLAAADVDDSGTAQTNDVRAVLSALLG